MSLRLTPPLGLLAVALVLGGCSKKASDSAAADSTGAAKPDVAAQSAASPNVVTITAKDYAFDAPDSIQGGLTTIHLVNEGKELHHVTLIRLDQGKTVEDLAAALKKPGPLPAWAVEDGGPNAIIPTSSTEETQALQPGNYALVCFVPSSDGVPHMAKGMMRAITVTAPAAAQAAEPAADVVMTLSDYSFKLSRPLTPGKHVIRIENAGTQPHELVLARLAPGKQAKDVVAWVDKMQGPPPGQPIGGVSGMEPGTHAFITVDLTPGDYGFICFLPDVKDGKPHAAHGMVETVKI